MAGGITALPVVAMFRLGLALGSTRAAVAMAIGANLIAIVSLVGAPRLPIRLALLDAVAMGVSVFVGSVTSPYPWLHTVVLIPWCFGAGMLVVFGQSQATVGTQAVIAYVVLGRFSGPPLASFHLSLLVLAGALVEVAALVALRLPPSLRYQRNRLADAFASVAELAGRDPHLPATDVLATLDQAERALSAPSLFGRTDVRDLRAALDQARRTRLELTTLAGLRTRLSTEGDSRAQPAIDSCLAEVEAVPTKLAAALRHPRRPTIWQPDAAAFRTALIPLEDAFARDESPGDLIARQCVSYLSAVGGQMRAAGNLVENARTIDSRRAWRPRVPTPPAPDFGKIRNDAAIVRDNLRTDSPAFRHAVRLAVAVPASAMLASWLSLPRSYWVPFAVAVILKPDFSTLFGRGLGRLIGTLLGATLAAVLVSELHPDLLMTTVLVALTAWAAYSTWGASFAVSIGFVTALVLILLSTSLTDTVGTAVDRL
ncbi:MAG TPA: FUSC family protein, partial [Acidimicrobiales bacterium]|nr:FUSC family protein [Acidimicrobiales bacterium]